MDKFTAYLRADSYAFTNLNRQSQFLILVSLALLFLFGTSFGSILTRTKQPPLSASSSSTTSSASPLTLRLGTTANNLRPGEEATVALILSGPTTPEEVEVEIDFDPAKVSISHLEKGKAYPTYSRLTVAGGKLGLSAALEKGGANIILPLGLATFRIKALSSGTTTLTFNQPTTRLRRAGQSLLYEGQSLRLTIAD